jgi:hypothetical protein
MNVGVNMFKSTLAAAAIAATSFFGGAAHAANIDLAFIMDRSGSVGGQFSGAMTALANALAANIPVGGPDTYRIGVVTFADNASVKVAPTVINSQAALDGVVAAIKSGNGNGSGLTNYTAAFNAVASAFGKALGDTSLINMMTDGVPTTGGTGGDGLYNTSTLQSIGWDSLSFESIGNSSGNNLLADICFGPGNPPGGAVDCPIYNSAAQISDPATVPFVLDLNSFADYNAVIGSKVAKIVNPDPIPVPAALPLLAGGLALFGFVGRRRRAAA